MNSLAALIPDGPLHPSDAAWGVVVGLALGLSLRSAPRFWASAVVAAGFTLFQIRHPGRLTGALDRPSPGWIGLILLVSGAAVWLGLRRVDLSTRELAVMAVGCLATVWATAPDTESALIFGAVVAGSAVLIRSEIVGPPAAVLVALPVMAAAAGTVGRPGRLPLVLGLAAAGVCCGALAVLASRQVFGRAGVPTTVVPEATSSTTTAPAPTTAP